MRQDCFENSAGRSIDKSWVAGIAFDRMSQKGYLKAAGFIFFLIAVLHLLRLVFGWEAVFEDWVVPHWVSAVALAVFGYLAYEGFNLSRG